MSRVNDRPTCSVCGKPLTSDGPRRPVDCCPKVLPPRAHAPGRDGLTKMTETVDRVVLDDTTVFGMLFRAFRGWVALLVIPALVVLLVFLVAC